MNVSGFRLFACSGLIGLFCGMALPVAQAQAPADPALHGTAADLPHGRVFYVDSGKGQAVLLLHPNNSLMWERLVPELTKAGYRAVAMDYRGVDRSQLQDAASSMARINELMDRLGMTQFHLLGTGGGGALAAQYALTFPERIRSLIAANTLLALRDNSLNEMEARLRTPPFDALPRELRELGPSYRAADVEGAKRWLSLSNAPPNGDVPPPSDGRSQASTESAGSTSPATMPRTYPQTEVMPVTLARLNEFKRPLLAITCDSDPYTPPSILRRFGSSVKRAEITVIADCGHSAYWESPEPFNRVVLSFIRHHSR